MYKIIDQKKRIILLLSVFILIAIFFCVYKFGQVPPCINADEAAFGYNAYSLLKTGKDEYGAFLPMRLISFLDYKLPLYSYLSIPFMAFLGLNDLSTRMVNIIVAILYVPIVYLLTIELFERKRIAILAVFLSLLSPWTYILTRHAHEGPLSVLFILLSFIWFIKFHKQKKIKFFILTNLALIGAGYSYHTARLFVLVVVALQLLELFMSRKRAKKQKNYLSIIILLLTVFFIFYPDIQYGANRVANLFYLRNSGFQARLLEYKTEHANLLTHNILTESIRDVSYRYFQQWSPDFLVINGDKNWRFGFQNLGLITPIEFFLIFFGLAILFLKNERYRWLILLLLFLAPLPNALTWQDASIIRSYLMIFPISIVSAFGIYHFFEDASRKLTKNKTFVVMVLTAGIYVFYLYNNWDIYLNHYPHRAVTVRAWQCGYKELAQYVSENYSKYDTFYITDRHGQPYIFLLYYLKFDPSLYQKSAKISAPDKYGFGQIYKFDKFVFDINVDLKSKRKVFIGYPEAYNDLPVDKNKLKHIRVGTEDIFWILET